MSELNVQTPQSGGPGSSSPPGSVSSPTLSAADVDTSAPFQSVKAAIGLFGELKPKSNAHTRSKSNMDERVLEKETQHHLTTKELDGLKEHLRSIETSKAQATKDLDKAKYTLDKLTSKLDALCESKQAAIVATEDAKKRLEELEEERLSNNGLKQIESLRDQYKTSAAKMSSVKEEITTLKQEFDAALEAKSAAFQEAADAQHAFQENQLKAAELSEQLDSLKREHDEVKNIAQKRQDEHSNLMAEKQGRVESCKVSREEIQNKIKVLKEESDQNEYESFSEKLEETNMAIASLAKQLNRVRVSDMEALRSITSQLELAKEDLQRLVSEENSLSSLADFLKQEKEINAAFKSQAEEMKKLTELHKQEAETARLATEETEKNLQIAMIEAKLAKATINPESIIKLTAQEFNALKRKAELLKTNADLKVATAKDQVQTIKANETPVLQKLKESRKENEALKEAIEEALKQADSADTAREVVVGELQKYHNGETSKIQEGGKL